MRSAGNPNDIYHGIGLMSGTSLDGMDLAYCAFRERDGEWDFELLKAETVPYDEQWYARLRCLDEQNAETYAKTHVYLGHLLGKTTASFIQRHGLKPDFVASHGQTIFHQPNKSFTAQIGDGETMVSYLDCPLVTNFRAKDVAVGGQGAPLVPFGERFLFGGHPLFLNLGGIANLSTPELAYDVCVCNMALNWVARAIDPQLPYDVDGQIAYSGKRDETLWAELESLPYYRQKPPKTLGMEWFQSGMLPLIAGRDIPMADLMNTLAEHIAMRICSDIRRLGMRDCSILVTGGGSHNRFLMDCLQTGLEDLRILIAPASDNVIDYKEAIIFGFLGLNTLLGRPNILASATGAEMDICGGSIHLPARGWKALL